MYAASNSSADDVFTPEIDEKNEEEDIIPHQAPS